MALDALASPVSVLHDLEIDAVKRGVFVSVDEVIGHPGDPREVLGPLLVVLGERKRRAHEGEEESGEDFAHHDDPHCGAWPRGLPAASRMRPASSRTKHTSAAV